MYRIKAEKLEWGATVTGALREAVSRAAIMVAVYGGLTLIYASMGYVTLVARNWPLYLGSILALTALYFALILSVRFNLRKALATLELRLTNDAIIALNDDVEAVRVARDQISRIARVPPGIAVYYNTEDGEKKVVLPDDFERFNEIELQLSQWMPIEPLQRESLWQRERTRITLMLLMPGWLAMLAPDPLIALVGTVYSLFMFVAMIIYTWRTRAIRSLRESMTMTLMYLVGIGLCVVWQLVR
jgi:hypothetical protein